MTKRISTSFEHEVAFFDVDSYRIVWHGSYIKYFEVARCKLLELIDFTYDDMEKSGYFFHILDVNIKYIKPLRFRQRFTITATLTEWENKLVIDYSLVANGLGMYGSKTVYYDNYDFDRPDDKAFSGLETIVNTSDNLNRPEAYWLSNRIEPLDKNDLGLYQMVDTLVKNPTYKR